MCLKYWWHVKFDWWWWHDSVNGGDDHIVFSLIQLEMFSILYYFGLVTPMLRCAHTHMPCRTFEMRNEYLSIFEFTFKTRSFPNEARARASPSTDEWRALSWRRASDAAIKIELIRKRNRKRKATLRAQVRSRITRDQITWAETFSDPRSDSMRPACWIDQFRVASVEGYSSN